MGCPRQTTHTEILDRERGSVLRECPLLVQNHTRPRTYQGGTKGRRSSPWRDHRSTPAKETFLLLTPTRLVRVPGTTVSLSGQSTRPFPRHPCRTPTPCNICDSSRVRWHKNPTSVHLRPSTVLISGRDLFTGWM